jgi:hypothetical protein
MSSTIYLDEAQFRSATGEVNFWEDILNSLNIPKEEQDNYRWIEINLNALTIKKEDETIYAG